MDIVFIPILLPFKKMINIDKIISNNTRTFKSPSQSSYFSNQLYNSYHELTFLLLIIFSTRS